MVWVEPSTQAGRFKISFRWRGAKFRKPVVAKSHREDEGIARRVDENISLAERGRLKITEGADVAAFLLADGEVVVVVEVLWKPPRNCPTSSRNTLRPTHRPARFPRPFTRPCPHLLSSTAYLQALVFSSIAIPFSHSRGRRKGAAIARRSIRW